MGSSTSPLPAVICAENIALLYLLHSVPDPPSRNSIDRLPIRQKGYTLSLQEERSLAGTLAFLSNLKDGPEHIPAVCVQEGPNSAFLNVLLAVNRARPGDGNEVLQNLKLGFERIFELLSRVSGDGPSVIESQIFHAIISMCSVRIHCRLRFISNSRNSPRQPIKELLQEAVNSIRWLENETVQDTRLLLLARLFVERAKEVIQLVDAWAKHRKPARLGDLVEGVNRLWRVGELQDLLSAIPNQIMGPTSRKNLLNIISKVARYREAARFLYRAAKKIPLVRQMKIVLVSLPPKAFQRIPAKQYSPTLPSTVLRINALHRQQWNVGQVCRLLNFSDVEANDQFVQQARKTLKDAKIHAEIQLFFHCELEAFKLPPRVFCSTKDACFLCNAFISMYGKIHTPRCHGRLYPGWRLPFSPKPTQIEQKFNRILANHIKNSLKTLLSRRQKTVYPDPLESTLLTLPMSASTLHSLAVLEAEDEEGLQSQRPKLSETDQISLNSEAISKPLEKTSSSPTTRTGDVLIQLSNDITPITLPSPRELSSDSTSVDNYTLHQGQILSEGVEVNRASPLYDAGHLEVQIEYSTGPSHIIPDSHHSNLSYSIEWLAVDEAERVLKQHASSIVNAELLEDEISHNLDDPNCFYIASQGSVVKIVFQSSNAELGSAL